MEDIQRSANGSFEGRGLPRRCHIVRHHHERIDGEGYPDGIDGDEIP